MFQHFPHFLNIFQQATKILKRNNNISSIKQRTLQSASSIFFSKECNFHLNSKLSNTSRTSSKTNHFFMTWNLLKSEFPFQRDRTMTTVADLQIPKHIQLPLYLTTGEKPIINPTDPYSNAKIHTEEEIEGIRDSCRLAAKVLRFAGSLVAPNVTTIEINQRVHDFIIAHGAYPSPLFYCGFPKSICTSVNEIASHGVPDYRLLQEGDIITIDITVYYNGYHGDCAATFPVGRVSYETRRLIEIARKCNEIGIAQCGPQKRFCDIGNNIIAYAVRNGFNVIANVAGHGIGRHFHDHPVILHTENSYEGVMQPGMIFTIEPIICAGEPYVEILSNKLTMVTKDRKWTACFEHTVLITANSVEILTQFS